MNTALGFGYAALIVYLANLALLGSFRMEIVRWMLLGLCLFLGLVGLSLLQNELNLLSVLTSLTVLSGAITAALFVLHAPTRQQLRRWLPANTLYQPDSIVHTTAIVFILFQVLFSLAIFHLSGGQVGLAATLEQNPPTPADALFSGGIFTLLALGGVGFYLRRNLPETLERLGLTPPPLAISLIAIGTGIAMQVGSLAFTAIWVSLTPPEVLAEQQAAGNLIALASASHLGAIFITAAASSIGEEILFRGALQPVFGITLTTLMFTFVHTQYLGSPALLFIAILSAALGWLRLRYGTTSAIIAHFVFNFTSLLMVGMGVS